MASYLLILSILIIFQIVNNSAALTTFGKTTGTGLKIFTPGYGHNGDRHYQYYQTSYTNCLSFKVRADKDAHIALAKSPNREEPWIEIVIGGWGNSRSVIRKDQIDYIQENTPLDAYAYLGFWITWNSFGEIRVGREGEPTAFMKWDDPEPFDIEYFAFSLCWNSIGSWIIEEPSCPNVQIKETTELSPKCYAPPMSDGSSIAGNLSFITLMIITYVSYKLF